MVDSSVSLLAVVVLHPEPHLGEKGHCTCDQGGATLFSGLMTFLKIPLSSHLPPPSSSSFLLLLQVCHEDVRKILHTISVQRPGQGWEFKLPSDQEFCNK